jgi:hypothetical protein
MLPWSLTSGYEACVWCARVRQGSTIDRGEGRVLSSTVLRSLRDVHRGPDVVSITSDGSSSTLIRPRRKVLELSVGDFLATQKHRMACTKLYGFRLITNWISRSKIHCSEREYPASGTVPRRVAVATGSSTTVYSRMIHAKG